ncbi:hypothetical protein [Pseudoalteromonas rhizosphaerae]|uniref:hypothetical protein n=1 Tax=Pseudoalteromonas rhizosphaerae TaxID=2518973 RepID=UPI0015D2D6D8|nr:hypothetical protein [Pseudoalteromonas rhizosphaerae]
MKNNNLVEVNVGNEIIKLNISNNPKVECFISARDKKRKKEAKERVYKAANNLSW